MNEFSRPATLDDLKVLVSSLNDHGADYLLIGGYALFAHGYHRATTDIDVLVPGNRKAGERIREALMVLPDKAAKDIDPAWFEEGDNIRVADAIVVDIMLNACGETYESLKKYAETVDLEGVPIRTVNLEGLLRTKQTMRDKDVADRIVLERAMATYRAQRGFTLTEIAIVLFIVALLLGSMMLPLSAQDDIRRTQDTQKMLNEVRDALIGFAVANGRLPCPATSATNGTELGPGNCNTDALASGYIPWATLGVTKLDGWEKIIRYSVTPAFANATFNLTTVPNRKVQTRDGVGALSYLVGQAAACTASQCTPAVVFSQGRHHWGTNDAGAAFGDGSATNADEDSNNAGPTDYIARPGTDNTGATGGEFDDLVIWLSPNILFNRMVAAGKLP